MCDGQFAYRRYQRKPSEWRNRAKKRPGSRLWSCTSRKTMGARRTEQSNVLAPPQARGQVLEQKRVLIIVFVIGTVLIKLFAPRQSTVCTIVAGLAQPPLKGPQRQRKTHRQQKVYIGND